jgi:hypothetical protein
MKTNRFEEILRRKLEGIQPDFQDQDWEKWQSFNKLHGSPSFWQSYGQWLGYAVATVTTAVMVVLYINQSAQNRALRQEMEGLKQQMEQRSVPVTDSAGNDDAPERTKTTPQAPDTVYIIEQQTVYRDVPQPQASDYPTDDLALPAQEVPTPETKETFARSTTPAAVAPTQGTSSEVQPDLGTNRPAEKPVGVVNKPEERLKPAVETAKTEIQPAEQSLNQETRQPEELPAHTETPAGNEAGAQVPSPVADLWRTDPSQTGSVERIELGEVTAPRAQEFSNSRNYMYRRLQARMPRRAPAPVPAPVVAQAEPLKTRKKANSIRQEEKSEQKSVPMAPSSADQKTEEIKKEESLLPRLGLGLPYRVGISQQWQGNTRAFSVVSEFVVSRHWAVQAGLSWRRLEPQKFFNEKMYMDRNREDIRKLHARKLPPSFEIFNINTETTLLQVPLGITYRGEMGNQFTYLIGTGTNLNVQARQRLTIDFRLPSRDYGQQQAERNLPLPMFNNLVFSAGIEKRWSPIVLQAGSFVETRVRTFPFLKDRTNVGFQVKILYELGSRKNN